MSEVEYQKFLGNLFDATEEFLNVTYDVVTVKETKIKLIIYGEKWGDDDFIVFKDTCRDVGEKFKNEFEKFGVSPTPELYFSKEMQSITVKWRVKAKD